MVMNSGSQELSQIVDSESNSEPEVAPSSLIRAPLAKKYGKVLLVVAALALVALAAGRAARAPHWTAAPDEAVKLQVTVPGPVADLGAKISAYSAGKTWPVICSEIYSVICTLPPGNPGTHTDAQFTTILKEYDDLDDTQEAEINNMLMTSVSAAGQSCPGVNAGLMCGSRRRRL